MLEERASGILLHPTSLPGSYGIGELGSEAYHFVDFLVAAKQKLWQVLPLGPTGYGDSPYASTSSFAGNPLLISIERLIQEDLLSRSKSTSIARIFLSAPLILVQSTNGRCHCFARRLSPSELAWTATA